MSASLKTFARCTLLACVLGAALPALADPRGPGGPGGGGHGGPHGGGPHGGPSGGPHGGPPGRGPGPGWHGGGYWGPRYGVPAHYPPPGRMVPGVPRSRIVAWGGVNYYWGGGVWYRPWGPSFVVVAPPLGIVVPMLPPAYVVRPVGGVTYYVANDVYYSANPAGSGYVVVAPPEGETYTTQGAVPAGDRVFVYPRNNQNAERQDRDRFDCHEWAVGQADFDPTQPQSGGTREIEARRSDYTRAFGACMEGRGYTVR